jgi:tape measure domain-containing protein
VPNQTELLNLVIQTQGKGDVAALAKSLYDVGQSGSEAAPQAQALLEQIAKLGEVANQAAGLPALKAQLQDVGDQLYLAKQRTADLSATITASAEPTAAQTRALQKAQQAVAALETQQAQLTVAIKTSENAIAAQGLSTENLDASQRALQGSLASTTAEANAFTASLNEAAVAGEREALTMSEIAERNAVLRSGFEQLKTVLGTIAGIVAFEKIKEDIGEVIDEGDKFAKLGDQFAAAFGGVQQGADALQKVKDLAEQTPLSFDEVSKAVLQAKKEGLDPFDGSLQAIIDTSIKYGGSADTVSELITQLGKSANTGGLNIRTLTALQQQGIPAAELLGAAMGKTANQVTELAKEGKLGSDSVALLIQQLGKSSTGGLSTEMGLVSTQVTKAKDNYDEFLNLIAQSGVYKFVEQQLENLNASFKKGLEDGTLQESAKAISDGLIGLGNALISVTKFAVDHGEAIGQVVKDYVAFKATMLGLDLIGAARNFLALAEATKAAGTAAEIAAAEGSGFGKLRTVINSIPKNVQIGLAVAGVDFALTETLKVIDTLKQINELQNQQSQQRVEDAALQARLSQQSAAIVQQNVNSAKTEIASTDELSAKNRQQTTDYITALTNAARYYAALQVQDKQLGDSEGAKAAGAKVTEYSLALQDATKHQQELNAELPKMAQVVEAAVDQFINFKSAGTTSAEAVTDAFKGIQIGTPNGLLETVDIIKDITPLAKDGGTAIQSELVLALQKLNTTDLTSVKQNVQKLFDDGKISASTFNTFMNATLQASLRNLGASAQQVGTQFDESGQKIIAQFTSVANSANASGLQIQSSFARALSQTTTGGEIDALKEKLQDAFNAGRISADQLASGMAAAGRKVADLQAAAIEADAGLDGMGTVGASASQRIVLALEDARDNIATQAQAIAASIAGALSLDAGADVTVLRARLADAEAAIADFNKRIQTASDASSKGLDTVAKGTQNIADATTQAGDQVSDATKNAERGYTEWSDAADAAALATAKVTADTSHANDSMAALSQGIADARAGFLSLSQAAADFYDTTLKQTFDVTPSLDGSGFDRVAASMQVALDETNKKIAEQREQLQAEVADIDNLGTSSNQSFGQFGNTAEAAAEKMRELSTDIQNGTYDAGILGQQDLAGLQAALDAATQRAEQLADAEKSAADQLADLNNQLLDSIDEATGNKEDQEDRRYQQQLQQIQDLYKQSGQLGTQAYNQAVTNANKLHQLNMQQIEQENEAKNNPSGSGTSTSPNASGNGNGIGGGGSNGGAGLSPINIHINGQPQIPPNTMYATAPTAQILADIISAKNNSI